MPINYSLYPPDWKERRERILGRANNRCEECGVPNHSVGFREPDGTFVQVASSPELYDQCSSEEKIIEIVLTIAHVVPDGPLDCPDSDLKALCQLHHNRLDAPMRARHRKQKRFNRQAVTPLLEVAR